MQSVFQNLPVDSIARLLYECKSCKLKLKLVFPDFHVDLLIHSDPIQGLVDPTIFKIKERERERERERKKERNKESVVFPQEKKHKLLT